MKKIALLIFVSSIFIATGAIASGSSGGGGVPAGSSVDPFDVTEMMKCVITEITPQGEVVVRNPKSKEIHRLSLTTATRLSAASKKDFDGRKELRPEDLKVGQELRVVTREVNGEVLKIKVLKQG